MAFQGNAAYQLDGYQAYDYRTRRSLSVHEGGVGARVSREASSSVAFLVKAIIALTLLLAGVGAARVVLTTRTVTLLSQVNAKEIELDDVRDEGTELRMERSALASTDRIQRIATENYGMVYASEVDTIVLSAHGTQDGTQDAQSTEATDVASPEA